MRGKWKVVLGVGIIVGCALFAGCTECRTTYQGDKGAFVSSKHVSVWPIFEAEKNIYTNAIHDEGDVLCFIRWSTWREARKPKDAAPEASAAAPADADKPPQETPPGDEN